MAALEVVEFIDVATDRAAAWAAVSDPLRYQHWSPEHVGARRVTDRRGADRSGLADSDRADRQPDFAVGDQFVGANRLWIRWSTSCTVVIADPQRTFAFDVKYGPFPVSRWEYSLSNRTGGLVRITERWTDHRIGVRGLPMQLAGILIGHGADAAKHNHATMRATLTALKAELEAEQTGRS